MAKETKVQRYTRLINKYIKLLERKTGKKYRLQISNETMLRGFTKGHKNSFTMRKINSLKNKIKNVRK